MIKKTLEGYSGTTKLLFENSAGAGEIIGDDLVELAHIMKEVASPFVAGICLDTQHSFASGYDWRNFEETISQINKEIGIDNIKLFHANDSQTEFNSNRDRHEHIGQGKIGLQAFRDIVAFSKTHDIDMILETEHDRVKEDIYTLKQLRESA